MNRLKAPFGFLLVASCVLAACGSDPHTTPATSVNEAPTKASAAPVGSGSAAALVVAEPKALSNAAGDPSGLLQGGKALEALPTWPTDKGKVFAPKLRERLMAAPADPLAPR